MARRKSKKSKSVAIQISDNVSDIIIMQLTDIEFYPKLSDETLAFTGKLNVIAGGESFYADCKNTGNGECTDIDVYNEDVSAIRRQRDILRRIDEWYHTQDDVQYVQFCNERGWSLNYVPKMSLESVVNSMLAEWCDENGL